MSESGPVPERGGLAPEDQARADFYALLSRLFAEAPDAGLLDALARAEPLPAAVAEPVAEPLGDALSVTLPEAWQALVAASAAVTVEAAADEYQTLFVGVGRSEVSLYASHYLGPESSRPLGDLRASLSELGLVRRPESSQYEDHLAVVLEIMRLLITGDATRKPAAVALQRGFFERHIASWAFGCCAAIEQTSVANYYRPVTQFMRSFLALERDSLAME